jgi:predicted glycogen debranching enzyme
MSVEWLEGDGLGGFASGCSSGIRTRRYHAWLLSAANPPANRHLLVNGAEAWVDTAAGRTPLTSHLYQGDVVHPDGSSRIARFSGTPWPAWEFDLADGTRIVHELFSLHDAPVTVATWRIAGGPPAGGARLTVRPLLSGRDPHALQKENSEFLFGADPADGGMRFRTYAAVPGIRAWSNGVYAHSPDWYRNFLYSEERARGFDFLEDLATPGSFEFDLASGEAFLVLGAEGGDLDRWLAANPAPVRVDALRAAERARRDAFPTPLHRAADAYRVRRGGGRTLIAGYPWFGDWGRDTFIALRGLCLATGRTDDARAILLEWAEAVSEGMLPNRFPDGGEAPEYNSVDASLWYVIAVHEWLALAAARPAPSFRDDSRRLRKAVDAILQGYSRGTRFGIRMDADGLLACGEPGVQLTWMDARIDDKVVVTPRIGKPVEVQALWLNALAIASAWDDAWSGPLETGRASFARRFHDAASGGFHDVVDVDHVAGTHDASIRPNQILAVGGLPFRLVDGARARGIVDLVERELLTPVGLRTLAPGDAAYVPVYEGCPRERDGAYLQGTVWPWLMGAFVDAWVAVRGGTPAVKRQARARFLAPLLAHLGEAGLGHVSEIFDAEPPHRPRGCPFQAWSLGELLRIETGLGGAAVAGAKARARRKPAASLAAVAA